MPELTKPELNSLVSALLASLRPHFPGVQCQLSLSPCLSDPSFDLAAHSLGQLIYIVPESISSEEAAKQIAGGQVLARRNAFHIVSDCRPGGQVLHISLLSPEADWRQPVRTMLDGLLGEQWEMAVVERGDCWSNARIGLLRANDEQKGDERSQQQEQEMTGKPAKLEIWMAPVNRRIVAGCTKKVVRKKIVRRVVRKQSKEENGDGGQSNGTSGGGTGKGEQSNGTSGGGTGKEEQRNGTKVEVDVKESKFTGDSLAYYNGDSQAIADQRKEKIDEPNENGNEKSERATADQELGVQRFNGEKATDGPILSNNGHDRPAEADITADNGNEGGRPPRDISPDRSEPRAAQPPPQFNEPGPRGRPSVVERENANGGCGPCWSPKEGRPSSPTDSGSDSPHSFQSAMSVSDTLVHRWRREDAPSPSTSLMGATPRARLVGALLNGGGPGIGLGPGAALGGNTLLAGTGLNTLSPISSCGSVEGQLEQEGRSSRTAGGARMMEARPTESAEPEDESTLMLLADVDRGSAGRSTLGAEEEPDELSCSLRDDFSLSLAGREHPAGGRQRGSLGAVLPPPFAHHHHQNNYHRVLSRSPPPKQQQQVANSSAQLVRGMLGFRMPVPVLQQVLSLLSFREMSLLRRVHPHWDELCGQLLNSAYFRLVAKAQRMLTDCQRRAHKEPGLAQPVQWLTRLHVHVLNPVDGMRTFMDEGVLCFPYGALLDHSFALLVSVEGELQLGQVTDNGNSQEQDRLMTVRLDQLAEMARRASQHYRQWIEPEAEKRMSELYRMSAQQRLQRLDSFLAESNVSRVEREAEKARDDLRWEMEQMKALNQQLKKENRELKSLCMRLDSRVEVLERKFRTMARLLQ